jgi:signal transduction histidine kinase
MQRIKSAISQLNTADMALIVVVVLGYIVGVVIRWDDLTLLEILVAFVMTAVYLVLIRGADHYFARFPSGSAHFAYFAIQLTLIFLISNILGTGAWLIALPLAALAVNLLSHWWQRWIIYIAVLAILTMPILRAGLWQEAYYYVLTIVPAIVFVVIFTRLVTSEQQARQDAEALAADLEEANRQLAAYSTQVDELARTKERNRLAREIHDNLGHYLTVVNVQIRAALAVMAADPQKAQEALDKAQRLTQEGLYAVRQSVSALRESPLSGRSLDEAIKLLVEETESSGIVAGLTVRGETFNLDPKVELTLYRAAQEGLTNVRKHARASQVDLTLVFNDNSQVALTVADNGVGVTTVKEGGYGLLGIQERVELLGGQMNVDSSPGEGFVLSITLPVKQPAASGTPVDTENV